MAIENIPKGELGNCRYKSWTIFEYLENTKYDAVWAQRGIGVSTDTLYPSLIRIWQFMKYFTNLVLITLILITR